MNSPVFYSANTLVLFKYFHAVAVFHLAKGWNCPYSVALLPECGCRYSDLVQYEKRMGPKEL